MVPGVPQVAESRWKWYTLRAKRYTRRYPRLSLTDTLSVSCRPTCKRQAEDSLTGNTDTS